MFFNSSNIIDLGRFKMNNQSIYCEEEIKKWVHNSKLINRLLVNTYRYCLINDINIGELLKKLEN